MTPIDIQVSRSKVSVEGQAFSLYVGEGGISVLQTAIFMKRVMCLEAQGYKNTYRIAGNFRWVLIFAISRTVYGVAKIKTQKFIPTDIQRSVYLKSRK